jgi:4-hydroxyphenylpyruvate dioxygenase
MTVKEALPEPGNPLGMDGIEFIEYATSQPQAFGALLQKMGFAAVARHRSREVVLYRQGSMNLIVNAHPDALPGMTAPEATPAIAAIALRVRDAAYAWRHALDLGAWEMPTRASAMELHIPGIHGVGDSLIYFVDRYRDFSIYDVDFVPLAGTAPRPPALAGLHYFGIVQAILDERTPDWLDFYRTLFGFSVLPQGQYFGVLPKGTLLESPCHKFYLQLIEPPPGSEDIHWDEGLVRIGLGAPDVPAATRALQERGIVFIDRGPVQPSGKGALTQVYFSAVTFELVVSHLKPEA